MQVIVRGRHTEVPDGLRDLAVRKIQRVRRFFDRIQTLEIEFSEEHNPRVSRKHSVEVTLTTKAHLLRASAVGTDPASAVDAVVDKLESQVKRLKGKLMRRGSRAAAPPRSVGASNGPHPSGRGNPLESAGIEEGEEGSPWPPITRTTRAAVKPMTPEEAVLQMEGLGHDFQLFVNAETRQVGVVYRRRDGTFGLIEPA